MNYTYIEIDLDAIKRNVQKIVETYKDYKYRVGVVKADCYGHKGIEVIRTIIESGSNYLAVSSYEEAIKIRKEFKDIPIYLLVPPPIDRIDYCIKDNIGITVANKEYINQILDKNVKVHIRVDCGFDFYNGPKNKKDFNEVYNLIKNSSLILEGIYMHNYCASIPEVTKKEIENFEKMTEDIDLLQIPVVSVTNSTALVKYEKRPYANAFRMGNLMYGIENKSLKLEDTFKLYSKIISIKTLNKGEAIGYNKSYEAKEDMTKIGILYIGYGSGFTKSNIGRYVYINNKKYKIVAVTLDITLVLIDDTVKEFDTCIIINGNRHIDEIAEHIHSIAEEELCCLNTRIPRIYVKKFKNMELKETQGISTKKKTYISN